MKRKNYIGGGKLVVAVIITTLMKPNIAPIVTDVKKHAPTTRPLIADPIANPPQSVATRR